jgi:SAM-dependent MidA family methyltransferase
MNESETSYSDLQENQFLLRTFFTFEEYMNAALYDSHWGFYGSGKLKLGADFSTMPLALSPVFAEMVAERFFSMYQGMVDHGSLSENDRFYVIEFGAGTGVMAHDVLTYCLRKSKQDAQWARFYCRLEYIIGERSRPLIAQQSASNADFLDGKIRIVEADAQNLKDFLICERPIRGVVFSNELLDVFPAHRVVLPKTEPPHFIISIPLMTDTWTDETDAERKSSILLMLDQVFSREGLSIRSLRKKTEAYADISPTIEKLAAGGRIILSKEDFLKIQTILSEPGMKLYRDQTAVCMRFAESLLPVAMLPQLQNYLQGDKRVESMPQRKGAVLAVSLGWTRFIREAAGIIDAGYIFTIDDGSADAELAEKKQGRNFPVMVYHHDLDYRGNNPYMRPGDADICASVDFSGLAREGAKYGFQPVFYGRLSALEDGLATKVSSEESILRIKERFMRTAVEMNLEPQLLSQNGLWGEEAEYFRQAAREFLCGRSGKGEFLSSNSKQLMSHLMEKAAEDADKRVPIWLDAFRRIHRILIQQKEGTDPHYVFSREVLPL